MSLIDCPECQQKISDCCYECGNCGYPIKKLENSLEEKREVILEEISNPESILFFPAPFSLVQFVPKSAIVKNSVQIDFLSQCSRNSGNLYFSPEYPCSKLMLSNGVIAKKHIDNLKNGEGNPYIHVSDNGIINCVNCYCHQHQQNKQDYFLFDEFIREFYFQTHNFLNLYRGVKIKGELFALVSISGIKNNLLGSGFFNNVGMMTRRPAIENNLRIRPASFVIKEPGSPGYEIFQIISNSIWRAFGKENCPRNYLAELI